MRHRFSLYLSVPLIDAERKPQYITYLRVGLSLLSLFQSKKFEISEVDVDNDPNTSDTKIDVSW